MNSTPRPRGSIFVRVACTVGAVLGAACGSGSSPPPASKDASVVDEANDASADGSTVPNDAGPGHEDADAGVDASSPPTVATSLEATLQIVDPAPNQPPTMVVHL